MIDFTDILEEVSHSYEKLKEIVELLEKELNILSLSNDIEKIKIGFSLLFKPNEIELIKIIDICTQFSDYGFQIYTDNKNLADSCKNLDVVFVYSKLELPILNVCLTIIDNSNRFTNCFILDKSLENQTIIQNISFENITNTNNNLIDFSCYKYIDENNLFTKINKIILSIHKRLKYNNFNNKEGVDQLREIYSAFDYDRINNDEESLKYFSYHKFSQFNTVQKFLLLRKNVNSFKVAKDIFKRLYAKDKNFVILVHKDSTHTTDKRKDYVKKLFEIKDCEYISDLISKKLRNNIINEPILRANNFISPVLTDHSLLNGHINGKKGNSNIGDILDWFNMENSPILFLIGQGGIGKTTLCHFLHDNLVNKNQIVFYINASLFESELQNKSFTEGNDAYDIYNLYTKWFTKTNNHKTLLTRNAFYSNLNIGSIKLIFDGLDELISSKPNFKLSSFVNYIESLVEINNLSKIVISIRDYQYKLLLKESKSKTHIQEYETYNVELFSKEMALKFFQNKFPNSKKIREESFEVLERIFFESEGMYKYPPYMLFLISEIVSENIVPVEDSYFMDLIGNKHQLDRILLEYLNREFGKKNFINVGTSVKDQLNILIDLAYKTDGPFKEKQAQKIIKKIKGENFSNSYFEKLKDHPYFNYDERLQTFDFQFEFLRDHLRSILLFNKIKKGEVNEMDIEIFSSDLAPQSILFKFLKERLENKKNKYNPLYKYINKIYSLQNDNEEDTFDIKSSVSNLFILSLVLLGKEKLPTEYTKLLKKIFQTEKNSNEILGLSLINCPHSYGITFDFSNLLFVDCTFGSYSRFFECKFNGATFFWENCELYDLNESNIEFENISAKISNFSENTSGDQSHVDMLLREDESYPNVNSKVMKSLMHFINCLMHSENKSNLTQFRLKKLFLSNKKYDAIDFEKTFSVFQNNSILNVKREFIELKQTYADSLSLFLENTYKSGVIPKLFTELKKEYESEI